MSESEKPESEKSEKSDMARIADALEQIAEALECILDNGVVVRSTGEDDLSVRVRGDISVDNAVGTTLVVEKA